MDTPDTSLAGWQPADDLLKGRVILITGAASGIGRAIAETYAAHAATLVLLDRDVPGLEQLYDTIIAAGHPEPALYPLDLKGATPDDYTQLAQVLDKEFGRLDGLVHNAAHLGALVPFANYDHELWQETMQVNLNAPYLLTFACLGLLSASKDASVIFAADAVGRQGKAYWGAYAVSKAGQETFMQVLADELEANSPIRVNSLDPGAVRTGLRRIAYPGEAVDTLATPADVTRPFLFLAGPDSRGLTGQQLSVEKMLAADRTSA